ncbi:hypothetical protein [Corynebacterium glyciniphilum]|uniref:hypothetical protein n=1 Tax=Corynebacterium glyciniphilum TaxID=1404244 RepID=UPI00130E028F|nr:hypothetical protein [Corynebacterium glyciniphilum]
MAKQPSRPRQPVIDEESAVVLPEISLKRTADCAIIFLTTSGAEFGVEAGQ